MWLCLAPALSNRVKRATCCTTVRVVCRFAPCHYCAMPCARLPPTGSLPSFCNHFNCASVFPCLPRRVVVGQLQVNRTSSTTYDYGTSRQEAGDGVVQLWTVGTHTPRGNGRTFQCWYVMGATDARRVAPRWRRVSGSHCWRWWHMPCRVALRSLFASEGTHVSVCALVGHAHTPAAASAYGLAQGSALACCARAFV